MSYTKSYSDWKNYPDTTTPITEAALDNIEAGIAAAHAATAKGDLVAAAAADDLRRLAVGGTNGHVLTVDSAQTLGMKWEAIPAAPVASLTAAIPGSPANGDEIIFVDSLSAPTYAWHLRYISAKASNKWQYIGGSSLLSEVTTGQTTASTTYADLATVGPSISIPVAGDYIVQIGHIGAHSENYPSYMSYAIGGVGASDADSTQHGALGGSLGGSYSSARTKSLTSVTLTAKYRTGGGTSTFSRRWMQVTPIAVGG